MPTLVSYAHIVPQAQAPGSEDIQSYFIPTPPKVSAKAYLLIDFNSGRRLVEHNSDLKVEPASLTKMMTVFVIDKVLKEGKIRLTDNVKISHNAWRLQGSKMFVKVNDEVKVEDLLKGIIIQSGNDASVAMAEYIAGSEGSFVEMMNTYGKNIGFKNTNFTNATGMPDPEHYTTASDMALLAQALMTEFPNTYKLYSEKWFTYQNIKQPNRNQLLWRYDWVDGIKTGHTDKAGYCLVASGFKDNMRLISVVMGTQSEAARSTETEKLLSYGFRFFETHKLYSSNQSLQTARVWMGKQKSIAIGVKKDIYVTVGKGQYPYLKTLVDVNQNLKAPLAEGEILGHLNIKLGNNAVVNDNLIALERVEKGSLFKRCFDYLAINLDAAWDKIKPS